MEDADLMRLTSMAAFEIYLSELYSESEEALNYVFRNIGKCEQVKRLPTAEELLRGDEE